MIKNVIFDIGNVLAGFTWQEFYRSFGFDEETLQKLAAATVKNRLWYEIDQGNMTTAEIVRGFQAYDPSIAAEIDTVFADLKGMVTGYEYAVPWLAELKERGYGVYIISNISEKVMQDCGEALRFLDLVDGAVFSCEVKMQKPDEAIYRLFLQRFGLQPEECIFLDDQEKNIAAARKLGIEGIIFENQAQAKAELEGWLE